MDSNQSQKLLRKPEWLRIRMPTSDGYLRVRKLIESNGLHTVCQEANCPNRGECFSSGTATFLILGSVCSRNCAFCNITSGAPAGYDLTEADRVVEAALKLELDYVVITSVTRDDLEDHGSTLFTLVTRKLRAALPNCKVELLIPDFCGDLPSFERISNEPPDVLNHNIETVRRLYSNVRPQADYDRSLDLFRQFGRLSPSLLLKSGVMVGLGETTVELNVAFSDLAAAGCRILTIGQYLQPSKRHHPVVEYYHPDKFAELKELALTAGIDVVESAPFVRSSYHAKESWERVSG